MKICSLCGKEFKAIQVIDGKITNLSSRKYCLECSPFKMHNTKRLILAKSAEKDKKTCSGCKQNLPIDHFWKKGKDKLQSRCKKCLYIYQEKRRGPVKDRLLSYKGGKCISCGYNKCSAALDFHHIDQDSKSFDIGKSSKNMNFDKIKNEIDKCVILCANCHRELHNGFLSLKDISVPVV